MISVTCVLVRLEDAKMVEVVAYQVVDRQDYLTESGRAERDVVGVLSKRRPGGAVAGALQSPVAQFVGVVVQA